MGNTLKTTLLLGLLSGLLLFIGDALGGRSGLVMAFGFAVLMNFASYWFSDKIVLAMYKAQPVGPDHPLSRIVARLAQRANLPMPKVYVIPDASPNAFATGRDPQHSHVVATRGLLDKLEPIELEAVIAHEMSHIGNYDIRIMTLATVLVGLVALISDLFLRWSFLGAGSRRGNRDRDGGIGVLVILVIAIIGAILAPIVAQAIKFGISRQREYLADASGALLCRHPEALARALEKISSDPEPLEVANKATAHLYISNPLKEHASFLNNMFDTHPPIEERIRLLRSM